VNSQKSISGLIQPASIQPVSIELGIKYRIEDIVPHAERMLLLEELVDYDAERVIVALTVRESAEFCVSGKGVPAWVGVEYMAQAVAAFSGIEEVQQGNKPKIGLLLGTRRYQCSVPEFPIGARLEIVANLLLRDESNLVAFNCEIKMDSVSVARADLKAVRPDDVLALVQSQS
jgi:predicted hotdog family 3-hydroxylacyl-ACP dehydratase